MKKIWLSSVVTSITIMSLITSITSCIPQRNINTQGGNIDTFKALLEESGFAVQQGAYGYQDAIALYVVPALLIAARGLT